MKKVDPNHLNGPKCVQTTSNFHHQLLRSIAAVDVHPDEIRRWSTTPNA